MILLQVCDTVDRVLKSPHAHLLHELNPVSGYHVLVLFQNWIQL